MRKNRGFTLVEIIVSIAIGSIVLLIAGGIILSSSNFLMTTTDMDIDKRAVDSIVDFVRGEIEYSTDVRFVQHGDELAPNYTEDPDWHYFYIKDNELYRDGAKVFAKSFTNNKNLSISMKGDGTSTSNHRLDIKYALLDNKNEISYSSRDTVMLLNLSVSQEILKQGIYSADYKDISDNGYWLFYTKKAKDLSSIPEEEIKYTGTVADQLLLMTVAENRWEWDSTNTTYRKGDMVYYNDKWWMWSTDSGKAAAPGSTSASFWKCLQPEWELQSRYVEGDIVIYKNQYYQRNTNDDWNQIPSPNSSLWNLIDESVAREKKYTIPKEDDWFEKDKKTIIDKLIRLSGYNYNSDNIQKYKDFIDSIPDETGKSWNNYNPLGESKPSSHLDFYKIKDEKAPGEYYHFYYRVYKQGNGEPGELANNGKLYDWQEISMDYTFKSAYLKDDIVFAHGSGVDGKYYQVLQNVCDKETLKYLRTNISNFDISKIYTDYLKPMGYNPQIEITKHFWKEN